MTYFKSLVDSVGQLVSLSILGHLNTLFKELDPVQDTTSIRWARFHTRIISDSGHNSSSSKRTKRINYQFLFAAFLMIFACAYGNFGLHYESTGSFESWNSLAISPYLVFHQMFPPAVWSQTDIECIATSLTSICVYFTYTVVLPIGEQHRMRYDGRVLFVHTEGMPKVTFQLIASRINPFSTALNRRITHRIITFRRLSKSSLLFDITVYQKVADLYF